MDAFSTPFKGSPIIGSPKVPSRYPTFDGQLPSQPTLNDEPSISKSVTSGLESNRFRQPFNGIGSQSPTSSPSPIPSNSNSNSATFILQNLFTQFVKLSELKIDQLLYENLVMCSEKPLIN